MRELIKEFKETPKVLDFLLGQSPKRIERLDSRWRKKNILFRVVGEDGDFVAKKVCEGDGKGEIAKLRKLGIKYSSLYPKLYVSEGSAYVMDFVQGDSFFEFENYSDRRAAVERAGLILSREFDSKSLPGTLDIEKAVRKLFDRYGGPGINFLSLGN